MDREYAAFISYRHLPLDMAVAARLHRRLEAYTIPRALRREGKKRLGLVFRDLEELPLTSSLTDDIHLALDHSKYLIVICTPDLMKSRYCLDEVDYFLQHHDRDHVLAVLASGEPAESFPPALLTAVDPGTGATRNVEPLAANVVCPSIRGSLKRLDSEFLRLVAAMLGCPYDHLAQRQRRARRRRLAVATAAVVGVLAVYAGMLLIKNRQISDQLRQTQINESEALAYQSGQLLAQGYGDRAVETALRALPSEQVDRPMVASAVTALADALHVYEPGAFVPLVRVDQDVDIYKMLLTQDGNVLVTLDFGGIVRAFDAFTGQYLWSLRCDDGYARIATVADTVLCMPDFGNSVEVYRLDGTRIGTIDGQMAAEEDTNSRYVFIYDKNRLSCYDPHSLDRIGTYPMELNGEYVIRTCRQSRDGRYCAVLCAPQFIDHREAMEDWRICCLDMDDCADGELNGRDYSLPMGGTGREMYVGLAEIGPSDFAVFYEKGIYRIDPTESDLSEVMPFDGDEGFDAQIQMLCGQQRILCITAKRCFCLNAETGALIWKGECSNADGIRLACWQNDLATGAYWIDGNGIMRGCCDITFQSLTVDNKAAALRAWLPESKMNMGCDMGMARAIRSTVVLAIHSPEAANSVFLWWKERDDQMETMSEYSVGQDWASATDDSICWGGGPLGGYTALEGGRWLLRKTGETNDGATARYEVINGDSGMVEGVIEIGALERPIGITGDGNALITNHGKYLIADGSVCESDPEDYAMLEDMDAAWKVSTTVSDSSQILQMYIMEPEKGRVHLELRKDGMAFWTDELKELATAQTPESLLDSTPYFFRMGRNGWGSIMLYDMDGKPIGLQLVDGIDHAFSRIEGDIWPVMLAFGERRQEPLLLSVDRTGQALVYRCSDAEVIARYELPFPPMTIKEIMFVMDDRALLIRQDYNRLVLLDARSGEQLWSWMPDAQYSEDAGLHAAWSENKLYLSLARPSYGEYIGGVRVNCDNWTTEGTFATLDQYLSYQNKLICYDHSYTHLGFIPDYDLPTLIGKGRAYLEARSDDN